MAKGVSRLLDRIEKGALDSSTSLADTLRLCVSLGGQAGSAELRDWARRELDGYDDADQAPPYRKVPVNLHLDYTTTQGIWTGKQISALDLPEFTRDAVDETVMMQGVAQLEDLVRRADGGVVMLQHSGMPGLVRYMNSQGQHGGRIDRIYWCLSVNEVLGILDRTRTALVAIVAELKDSPADAQGRPTPQAAAEAVGVVVYNRGRGTVNISTATVTAHGGDAIVGGPTMGHSPATRSRIPSWVRGPWVGIGALVALGSGVAGIASWVGWSPF